MSILDTLRQNRTAHTDQQTVIINRCEADARNLSDDEAAEIRQHRSAKEALDERITELEENERRDAASAQVRSRLTNGGSAVPSYDGVHRVGAESRTYNAGTAAEGLSFFRDAFGAALGDPNCQMRQARHNQESVVESRATTTASFAGIVPPQYLVDAAALVVRQGRPTADVVNKMDLPAEGMTLNIPRGTTGATVASQTPENTAVSNTDEVWSNVVLNVVTIAGQQDISRQAVERGHGVDHLIFMDLAGAWAAELDRQVLNGSGASNQMLGILNTAGTYSGTAFASAVTATNFYSHVGGGLNAVLSNRFLPPTHVVMSPRRYAWLLSQVDGSGRPLVVPGGNLNSGQNAQGIAEFGDVSASGTLMGLRIVVDANMPIAVGTQSEDQVIVMRASDCWLYESGGGAPTQLRFEQTLGNQLTVKVVLYSYAAFTAARYPQSVAFFGGKDTVASQGLVAPTLG